MRFTQFLIEADEPQHGPVKRAQLATRQQQRRDTKKRAELNKQALSANATAQGTTQPAAPAQQRGPNGRYAKPDPKTGFPQRPAATGPDSLNLDGSTAPPESKTGMPQRPVSPTASKPINMEYVPQEVLKLSQGNREAAVEFMTLLGSMYQTKRKNPEVQMTTPKMVEQSKNKPQMQALFKAAQSLSLAQLAQMTQEIKKVAAAPGSQNAPQQGGAAPTGQTNVPQAPGATPAQQTVTQNLANKITQAAKSLPPASLKFLKDLLGKSSKKAKANPMQAGRQQPMNAPVVTQGQP